MFCAHTTKRTSTDVVKARVTWASILITSPNLMGCLNDTLSTEAVTTMRLQCFWAEIAAAMSIQWSRRPPMRLLSVLVSLGSTNSFMMVCDSRANFSFMLQRCDYFFDCVFRLNTALFVCYFLRSCWSTNASPCSKLWGVYPNTWRALSSTKPVRAGRGAAWLNVVELTCWISDLSSFQKSATAATSS